MSQLLIHLRLIPEPDSLRQVSHPHPPCLTLVALVRPRPRGEDRLLRTGGGSEAIVVVEGMDNTQAKVLLFASSKLSSVQADVSADLAEDAPDVDTEDVDDEISDKEMEDDPGDDEQSREDSNLEPRTEDDATPYNCDLCDKGFHLKQSLQKCLPECFQSLRRARKIKSLENFFEARFRHFLPRLLLF